MRCHRRAVSDQPDILLESFARGNESHSYRFRGCESVIRADTPDQVSDAVAEVERAVARGRHAAGFVSYEAASGLNPDLPAADKAELPLVWFGIFAERSNNIPETVARDPEACSVSSPEPSLSYPDYLRAIDRIREAIARGETYQVNFTARQRFSVCGDPYTLYRRMCSNQLAPFCGWIDIGTHKILSASPELFFSLKNGQLTMRPMKGTAPRGTHPDEDLRRRDQLSYSVKDRAENLMIVDLVRNDLAPIAVTGSVQVPALFEIETYPTVHQMTSTVTARIKAEVGLLDIFRALFPCGSITGAPKRQSMKIIGEMEAQPRGVYCGAIGYVSPGLESVFSVAIRTVVVNSSAGTGEIGIGSGITWGSNAEGEYRECLAKSAFLTRDSSPFSLIESLRRDRQGILLLERHIRRLARSAAYFGFNFDADALRQRLHEPGSGLADPQKVRVVLEFNGSITLESQPLFEQGRAADAAFIALSEQRVHSSDPFLYHKTSRRALYDEQLHAHADCYDVIFRNEREEVTEGCYNTIVISLQGELLTPAIGCGLLPGVLREELIEVGAIREAVLTLDDLRSADTIWLVNSVRGWRECRKLDLLQQGEHSC